MRVTGLPRLHASGSMPHPDPEVPFLKGVIALRECWRHWRKLK